MTAKIDVGWSQVVASSILMAISGMVSTSYGIIAVPLSREFHQSRMVLMLAMTIMALVAGLLAPVLGSLMDRSSLRRVMALGAGCLVSGFLALSFVTSFSQVLIIYGLFMAPATLLIGPLAGTVLLSRWFVRRRGRALGIAISGIALGGFVFPPLIQGLFGGFDWRNGLRLLSLIVFLCTMPAVALIVNHPADKGRFPDGADSDLDPENSHGKGRGLSVRAILTDPAFWLAATLFAVVLSGMQGVVTNLVPLAVDQGIKAGRAALLVSVYAGCCFVAKLTFALVADRFSLRPLMFISLAGFGLGMACMIRADAGYGIITLGVALIGLFGGAMVPMQSLAASRIFGRHSVGRAAGLLSLVSLCALLATPPMFGLIFDLTGNYADVFIVFTALVAVTMLAIPYIRLHPRAAAG